MSDLLRRIRRGDDAVAYVHCASSVEYVGALHPSVRSYPERALLLARREDLVCLEHSVEPEFLKYLMDLGLGPEPSGIVVADPEQMGSNRPLWSKLLSSENTTRQLNGLMRLRGASLVHPFMVTPGQFDLAAKLRADSGRQIRVLGGDPDTVAYADFKHHIRAAALALGIPVASGEVLELAPEESKEQRQRSLSACIHRQIRTTGRVIVRGTSGASGSSTQVVRGTDQIGMASRRLCGSVGNQIFLVEALVEATASPNVQMHVDSDTGAVACLGVTDQVLSADLTHTGNAYPSVAQNLTQMIGWAETAGRWLRDAGYAGILGLDFVEYRDEGGRSRAFLAEVNPRVNGGTYPLALCQRLGGTAFVSGVLDSEIRTFHELQILLSELLYTPGGNTGIVPYATGSLQYGKIPVIALAPTRAEAAGLLSSARQLMEGACLASL